MSPRFSVLIPVYNRQSLVREAIDSVLNQAFDDYEVIVIDDGSSDGTLDVLKSYGNRVKLLQQGNCGPEVARNLAVSVANGEYLVLLDSDDLLLPLALQVYDRVVRKFKYPPVIIGSMVYFRDGEGLPPGEDGCALKVVKYVDFLGKTEPVGLSNSRIVVRRSLYEKIGGARQSSPETFHADDVHLMLKLGTYGPCIIVHRPITVAYRVHGTNSIHSVTAILRGITAVIRSERRGEYPGGLRRRFARYACIGGIAWLWVRMAWRLEEYKEAVMMLSRGFPMVVAGACKKTLAKYHLQQPIEVSSEE